MHKFFVRYFVVVRSVWFVLYSCDLLTHITILLGQSNDCPMLLMWLQSAYHKPRRKAKYVHTFLINYINQHCGYWWPASAPGHQKPQCWAYYIEDIDLFHENYKRFSWFMKTFTAAKFAQLCIGPGGALDQILTEVCRRWTPKPTHL